MRKLVKVLLGIVIVLGLFWAVINIIPPYKVIENNPFRKGETTLISAHRGGSILNPENTEKAFDYVILETSYTDIVEIDVQTTKDGELVIIHDGTINETGINENTPSDDVKIKHTDYKDLLKYNLGVNFEDRNGNHPYRDYDIERAEAEGLTIMRLEDFLIKYNQARDFKLYLEIKEDNEEGKLALEKSIKLLNKYSWWKNRTMIISFSTAVVEYVPEVDKDMLVGALGYKIAPELVCGLLCLDSLVSAKYHGFQTSTTNSLGPITVNCATKRMVKMAHKRNQSITYWTINDEDTMKHLIDIDVDVITTDCPDVLAKILGKI